MTLYFAWFIIFLNVMALQFCKYPHKKINLRLTDINRCLTHITQF